MRYWETAHQGPDEPSFLRDFADIWRSADKVDFSRTLGMPSTVRTPIERDFDPDRVSGLKASAERDLTVGGAELAGQALGTGLVDELHLFVVPES